MLNDKIEVDIPKSRIVIKKNGYVYYTKKTYRNDSGKVRSDRILIGRKKDENKMVPNQKYYEIYNAIPITIPDTIRNYGNTYLLNKILKKLGIIEILKRNLSEEYKETVIMAMYMISNGNVMQYISNWCEENYLEYNLNITSQIASKIFAKIDYDKRMKFFKEWSKVKIEDEYLAYDITSISSYADIDIVEYGYNRDKEELPQINLGMYYGEKSRLPVYYNVYSGSITDKTELEYMFLNCEELNIEKVRYVMDKGFFSSKNLKFFDNNNLKIIIPVSLNLKYTKELLKKYRKEKMCDSRNRVPKQELFAVSINTDKYGIKSKVHIYYNGQKDLDESNALFEKLEKYEEQLKKCKKAPIDNKKYTKYFNINVKENGKFEYVRKDNVINEELSKYGYLILLNNDEEMNSLDTINIYRDKDCIEKSFDDLKNSIDMKRLKVHRRETMEGKIFVAFIGLVIKSYMQKELKDYIRERNLTIQDILNELKKIKVLEKGTTKVLMQPLTKTQKEILEAFDIDENELKSSLLK